MVQDRRLRFVKKWFQRGVKSNDPFDTFFFLWTTLVVAAQYYRTRYGGAWSTNDTDREKVVGYFRANKGKVLQALEDTHSKLMALVQRRGTDHGNPIVDTGNPELREKFSKLAKHYRERLILSDEDRVEAVAELLNKIRNMCFMVSRVTMTKRMLNYSIQSTQYYWLSCADVSLGLINRLVILTKER